MNSRIGQTAIAIGALIGAVVLGAHTVSAAEPCCGVTSIDARSGVVSARDTATGRTFQFTLDDRTLLTSIKVGQVVEADFQTMKVTVRPAGIEPCCSITAINARTGEVSLKVNATSRTAQLTVTDAKLLGTLKVGQTVDANLTTGSIAIAPTGVIQR